MPQPFAGIKVSGRHREDRTRTAHCPYCGSPAISIISEAADIYDVGPTVYGIPIGQYREERAFTTEHHFSPCGHRFKQARSAGPNALFIMNPEGKH